MIGLDLGLYFSEEGHNNTIRVAAKDVFVHHIKLKQIQK